MGKACLDAIYDETVIESFKTCKISTDLNGSDSELEISDDDDGNNYDDDDDDDGNNDDASDNSNDDNSIHDSDDSEDVSDKMRQLTSALISRIDERVGSKRKLTELEGIFNQTSNEMERKRINMKAIEEIKREHDFEVLDNKFKAWAMNKNNFCLLGQKVINEKEVGEKRPILESPTPTRKSKRLETDEQRNADFNRRWQEARDKALAKKRKDEETKQRMKQEN
ncbi:hypothetical protein RhiirB3_437297 [Rhizophagus irregularis]|nr:hypothetical protein RhiirB3_437297 [Rhizophagus irregularis]